MSRGVLLLGGGGFIGTALARRLTAAGRTVHILARRPFPLPGALVHQGNLDDLALLERLLPVCDTVIHLASETNPGLSAQRPSLESANLVPTLVLLEILQAFPAIHLIYLSSGGALYGNPSRLPVSEESPLSPLSYHGAGKAALEAFLHPFRVRGHAVTILRPSNAYGPAQALRGGFGLIRTMLEHAHRGTALEIWGDGENVRDFIYIDDLAEACARFVALPHDSDTYNVGSGRGYSLRQVQRIVEQVIGAGLSTVCRPSRGVDVRAVVLDISRLEARLAWKPETSLEEGVRRTWNWLRQI